MLRRALLSPPVLISLIVVLVASTLPLYVSGYVLGLLTIAYYFGVFSMAWDLLFGFANEVNFGPSFLIGLGAYTAGILDNLYQPPIALCIAAGVLAAMTGGARAGAAGAEGARALFRPHHPRRGADPAELRRRRGEPDRRAKSASPCRTSFRSTTRSITGSRSASWRVSGAILYGLSRSPVGLILEASGQDPVQAGALGFNVTKHKLAAFLVSAFFSGLAGALMAFYLGAASVGTFIDVTVGVQVIIGAVIGGRRTILGARAGRGVSGRPRRDAAPARRSRDLHRLRGRALRRSFLPRPGFSAWSRASGRRHERPRAKARGRGPPEAVRRPDGGEGRQLLDSCRRDSRPDRTERIGQVDGDEIDPRRRAAGRRIGPGRRPRGRGLAAAPDRPARRRHGVPAFASAAIGRR